MLYIDHYIRLHIDYELILINTITQQYIITLATMLHYLLIKYYWSTSIHSIYVCWR